MERAVEVFAVINLEVIGMSHILLPKVWIDFFVQLREKGRAGVFVIGFMSLFFGSIIVAFHNVWSGLGLGLTLLGWAQVLKAVLYFLFPAYGLRMLRRVDPDKPNHFIVAGVGLMALGGMVASAWL